MPRRPHPRPPGALPVRFALLLVLAAGAASAAAQPAPPPPETTAGCVPGGGLCQNRFWGGNAAFLAADAAVMTALGRLWYSDYERTRFHFHDDLDNWAQLDKLGHLAASWHLARALGRFGRWAGLSRGQAALYGGLLSTAFETQIEILDGFSAGWGASWTDAAFNAAGAALGAAQVARPGLDGVTLKWSYHRSPFYDDGVGLGGNALKDYDGVTFWVVARPRRIGGERLEGWPAWLGVSAGYGAEGLASALPTAASPHRRELYVGLDLDLLAGIRWPRPWMRTTADLLSFIRIPAPALQLAPDVRFHPLFH